MDQPTQGLTRPLKNVFFHFIDFLNRESIPYAVIGGIAVTLTANERFTRDADFTVLLTEEQSARLVKIFQGDPSYEVKQINFNSSQTIADFFRVIWQGTPVDLLVANTDYQKELIVRAKTYRVQGADVRIATPEDLIVLKLLADRPVDRQDIEFILKVSPSIDWNYIQKWCAEWGIEDRLKTLRAQSK